MVAYTHRLPVWWLLATSLPAIAAPGLDSRPANPTCVAPDRTAATVPVNWQSGDVGAVGAAGSTIWRDISTATVQGSGADIWGTADAFQFVDKPLTGDGDLVARVLSLGNTDPWAKAGVMLRESRAPGSRFALMMMTPGANGASFQYRTATDGNAGPSNSADKVTFLPRWVRISRRGNVISGYHSVDGNTWTFSNSVTLNLPGTIRAGLAVTSHANGTLATASFTNIKLTQVSQGPAVTVATEDPFAAAPDFNEPTKLLQAPGDGSRWFVLEKTGKVKVFSTAAPAAATTWLDFSSKVNTTSEGGLLGMAFHPLYPARREVFVAYTTGNPMQLVVSRLILDQVAAPATVTEQVLLTVDKPYANHNGGDLAFGTDNYLYISVGDGGSGGDPNDYAQNQARLLGKLLRIDAWDRAGWPNPRYAIPADNPYAANPRCGPAANGAPCPELYAWGFRNPWRFSIDAATGNLWVADVGQNEREEIDRVVPGGNYGWRCREGTAAYNMNGCPSSGLIEPVYDYPHADGNVSITGGAVYRGAGIPALQGRYVFGDFASGRIWALRDNGSGGYEAEEIADTGASISSFGAGQDGELYFTDYGSGRLQRLVNAGSSFVDVVPDDLAATGCVNPANPVEAVAGAIPYSVIAQFWSDGATKRRYLALPDGKSITVGQDADWQFPPGSVLIKTMSLAGTPVETRLLMRHPDGGWAGYTYEWNAAATAATRVRGGKTRFISGRDWIWPSEGQCMQCHTNAAGISLGPETAQLNSKQMYPTTNRVSNQLETLSHIGVLPASLGNPATQPRLATPLTANSVEEVARAYLHANCSYCHRPGGPTDVDMDLRYTQSLADTHVCNAPPQAGDLGIAGARLIVPGDPAHSILLQRMLRRDAQGMPPLASSVPDSAGAQLITNWINELGSCRNGGGSCHQAMDSLHDDGGSSSGLLPVSDR